MSIVEVRVDKFLWAVRFFKTRTLAAHACQQGLVRVNASTAKPSRQVRPGDHLEIECAYFTRTLRVKTLLERRVGAKLVPEYVEELTPASEWLKQKEAKAPDNPSPGVRPTKKQRRLLERFRNISS